MIHFPISDAPLNHLAWVCGVSAKHTRPTLLTRPMYFLIQDDSYTKSELVSSGTRITTHNGGQEPHPNVVKALGLSFSPTVQDTSS